jgi:hypothetical protein
MDSYGSNSASYRSFYMRENKKSLFILKASSTLNITLFSSNYIPGWCSINLIGHYIDSNGNPVIEGSYSLPPALAAKL